MGGYAAPLFEVVEASFGGVAVFVGLGVEGGRAAVTASLPGPVACLVGPLGDRVGDGVVAESGADRLWAVALVAQEVVGLAAGATRSDTGHPDRFHHGSELGAVVRGAACDDEAERTAPAVAARWMSCWSTCLWTGRGSGRGAPFSGPGRMLVSADGGGVDGYPPVDVACRVRLGLALRSIRLNALFPVHLRKRVWSVAHGPYRSGTSR